MIKRKLAKINKNFKTANDKANAFTNEVAKPFNWSIVRNDNGSYFFIGPRKKQQISISHTGKVKLMVLQRSAKSNNIAIN